MEEPATKNDLKELRDDVRQEMHNLNNNLDRKMDLLHEQLRSDLKTILEVAADGREAKTIASELEPRVTALEAKVG